MRKKKISNSTSRTTIAIAIGITIVGIVIFLNYHLDQTKLSGQRFGDQLAQIQSDLKNETQNFDIYLTQYKNGQISKDSMLKITDNHIQVVQNMLPKYNKLNPPELFSSSLQLFRMSTEVQIESDRTLKDWILTGNNATLAKSDHLLQQSFQYEMNALQSYENAKSRGSE